MKLLYQNYILFPNKLTANKIVRLIFVTNKPASNFEKHWWFWVLHYFSTKLQH